MIPDATILNGTDGLRRHKGDDSPTNAVHARDRPRHERRNESSRNMAAHPAHSLIVMPASLSGVEDEVDLRDTLVDHRETHRGHDARECGQ
jgi:hypothetical protein